jgi:hypothetical protein
VKKRGLPEGYVRGLEKLWGLAIRDVDQIEDNMLEAINRKNGDQQDWNDEAGSESLVKLWRKSQLSQELERVLSSIETVAESSKRKRCVQHFFVKVTALCLRRPSQLPGFSKCISSLFYQNISLA